VCIFVYWEWCCGLFVGCIPVFTCIVILTLFPLWIHLNVSQNAVITIRAFIPRLPFPVCQEFPIISNSRIPGNWISQFPPSDVQGMTLNCIHIFIVIGSFLHWCVMRPASQRFFIHSCIYLRIVIISYLATLLGTNSLSLLMCHRAVNQSINQSIFQPIPGNSGIQNDRIYKPKLPGYLHGWHPD